MKDKTYPNVAEWVKSHGWVEIGQDEHSQSFIRALDIGGMVWEGKKTYPSLDDAFHVLDNKLKAEINMRT
jgi:hypothetical protein